ncbi:hypothetical protein LX32DRAFT_2582 [Colletotrichum zoysiae]|uniref:Uncharacterized protein n=1 Tax=Colletotrichum zoysiae TaxID=1216348 RepID=A0AAD9HWP9_9PEZI|nr:hypothetical protein LX32DRAFT_2582 [Colletotrichum zoysiae]
MNQRTSERVPTRSVKVYSRAKEKPMTVTTSASNCQESALCEFGGGCRQAGPLDDQGPTRDTYARQPAQPSPARSSPGYELHICHPCQRYTQSEASWLEGWPSWLWRQVKVSLTSVSWWGNPREFESRPFQYTFAARHRNL